MISFTVAALRPRIVIREGGIEDMIAGCFSHSRGTRRLVAHDPDPSWHQIRRHFSYSTHHPVSPLLHCRVK
jgi:hypothetical protein